MGAFVSLYIRGSYALFTKDEIHCTLTCKSYSQRDANIDATKSMCWVYINETVVQRSHGPGDAYTQIMEVFMVTFICWV